jgi:hypothetical protein
VPAAQPPSPAGSVRPARGVYKTRQDSDDKAIYFFYCTTRLDLGQFLGGAVNGTRPTNRQLTGLIQQTPSRVCVVRYEFFTGSSWVTPCRCIVYCTTDLPPGGGTPPSGEYDSDVGARARAGGPREGAGLFTIVNAC